MEGKLRYREYVCRLSPELQEKACRELKEDVKNRQGAIDTLRRWTIEQPHINSPLDGDFLVGFLRTGKYSQLTARRRLENYMSALTKHPHWFRNIDTHDPQIDAVLDEGAMTMLPGKTKDGCAVFFGNVGNIDPSSSVYNSDAVFRTMVTVFTYMMWQEDTQVNGFVEVSDFGKFTMKHHTSVGMSNMKEMTKHWRSTFPLRFKGFNYYNAGSLFETVFNILKPLMGKKLGSRIRLHSTLETVYDVVPMEILPDEYLPDDYEGPRAGPMKALIDAQKQRLQAPEFRNLLLERTSDNYGIESAKVITDQVQESFRKLNVD